MTDSDRKRFDDLWNEHAASVYAYAARRIGTEGAEEVVSEVFAVAWRRVGDIPERELPWLYGVGRNVIRQRQRSLIRRDRLERTLADHVPQPARLDEGSQVAEILLLMTEEDQEVLRLVAWEGLTPQEAAQSLGITSAAFRMRLSRARRRFRSRLEQQQVIDHES